MTVIVLPYPDFQPNTMAVADQIDGNNAAIINVANGAIDDSNLANNGITASSKIIDGTIDAACMGTSVIRQAQMDYTSANSGVLVPKAGPNYGGANGRRLAWVSVSKTPTATNTEDDFVFTFASNCVDGDPAFTAAPYLGAPSFVYTAGVYVIGDLVATWYWGARSTTQCTLHVVYVSAQPNPGIALTIEFPVWGAA